MSVLRDFGFEEKRKEDVCIPTRKNEMEKTFFFDIR